MHRGYWDDGWGWWLGMGITMVVASAFVIAVVIALLRRNERSPVTPFAPPHVDRPDARSILDERLARGEIEPDEYHRRREALDTARR